MLKLHLPPILSWREFLAAATSPPTIEHPSSRSADTDWQGASWAEAVRLGTDGWPMALEDAGVSVAELRESVGLGREVTMLEPSWDVTGSEVDIGAYLAGVPECMVDAVPRRVSRHGKVVAFLIPAGYSHRIEHDPIINRGLALAALCTAIIDAGHSVEIWSGYTGILRVGAVEQGFRCVARVISAGEPFDVGRLIFAVAHPAMLRRLWFGVWDAQPAPVAAAMEDGPYGTQENCRPQDLPAEVTDPYVLPYLAREEQQWNTLSGALSWVRSMFAELGLVRQ